MAASNRIFATTPQPSRYNPHKTLIAALRHSDQRINFDKMLNRFEAIRPHLCDGVGLKQINSA